MRKFLTLRVSFFWMLLGLLSFANTASAQDYYIVITQGDDAIKAIQGIQVLRAYKV